MANPRAGQPAQPEDLVDLPHLVKAYYTIVPDPDDVAQQVVFGTSGHRGSALNGAFNEAHILATTQAIVEYRTALINDIGIPSYAFSKFRRMKVKALPFRAPSYKERKQAIAADLRKRLELAGVPLAPWRP